MGKVYDAIDDSICSWLDKQHMFFVATAPLDGEGLVNCSPKGYDSFRVLDEHTIAYLDLTGSGVETIAHVKENGRIVVMFCAFEGAPKIVRFHGNGKVYEKGSPEFDKLEKLYPDTPGTRAIIQVSVTRISDSCGFGVPFYEFKDERDTLIRYSEKEGVAGMSTYREKNNRKSLDGLIGFES